MTKEYTWNTTAVINTNELVYSPVYWVFKMHFGETRCKSTMLSLSNQSTNYTKGQTTELSVSIFLSVKCGCSRFMSMMRLNDLKLDHNGFIIIMLSYQEPLELWLVTSLYCLSLDLVESYFRFSSLTVYTLGPLYVFAHLYHLI